MNFTREPIIETIISPKEGYKLLVRNSKGGGSEEYFVDAVEVVSFGHSFFFRCLERPKAFLVPASDYEVLEVKEARLVLKSASHERNIKIGGGRDAPPRAPKEPQVDRETPEEDTPSEEVEAAPSQEPRPDRKQRDRRRHRRRRSTGEEGPDWQERRAQEQFHKKREQEAGAEEETGESAVDEAKPSSPAFSTLFPPPPTLISETISRYKDKEFAEGTFFTKPLGGKQKEEDSSLATPSDPS